MTVTTEPSPISAVDAPERLRPSNYPEPFAALTQGRMDIVGLHSATSYGLTNGIGLVQHVD